MHAYWIQLKAADGPSDEDAIVCLGNSSPTMPTDVQLVDAPKCHDIALAWVAVHQAFLTKLDSTPAPRQFKADDKAIRVGLPIAISDLRLLISVASTDDKAAVRQAALVYVGDMIPAVTHALDDIDPTVAHN